MPERLPLTALEEYFHFEDRQSYPWSFFIRLDFAGRADRQAAEVSLGHCVARHPLLSSVVQQCEAGQLAWRPVEAPSLVVRWTEGIREKPFSPATRLDITEEIGVRLHANAGQEATQLVFQFNHACCDARGAITFIEDWLVEYARSTGGRPDPGPPRTYDPGLLARRAQPARPARRPLGTLLARWAGLVRACRFLAHTPVPLLEHQPARDDDSTPAGFPSARNHRFDEASTSDIRSSARGKGVTVNDLLCCELFLAMHDFRRGLRQDQPDAWLRLVVPVDLRTQAPANMSAANLASLVFLTRRASACNDSANLLRSIHREMHQVKSWGLASTFVRSLRIRKHLPGGLARAVRRATCGATAALTNLGETFTDSSLPGKAGRLVAGNLVLDGVDFLAPIRPLTCVSLASCTYAGRLSISLQYDPRALSESAADRLFDTFLFHVRSSLR